MVAVEDNATVMKAGPEALLGSGGDGGGGRSSGRCVTVSSYLEAVGVLACHKAGINPVCLTPEEAPIRQMPPIPVALEGKVAAAAVVREEGTEKDSRSDVAVQSQKSRSAVAA